MNAPHERLADARNRAGKSHREVAQAAGLSLPNYYDLETYEDEIFMVVSLRELQQVCSVLGIAMIWLFTDETPSGSPDFKAVAEAVRLHLSDHNQPLTDFENQCGWELGSFIDEPNLAWEWCIAQLRDVCSELGIDWFECLRAGRSC